MNNPNKTVPLFDGDGFDEITCQEKDAILASNETLNDDGECMLARGLFEIDMAVWCGCEGAGTFLFCNFFDQYVNQCLTCTDPDQYLT